MLTIDGVNRNEKKIGEILQLNLPIFIWGEGEYSHYVEKYLRYNGINGIIRHVVDDEFLCDESTSLPLSVYINDYSTASVMVFGFFDYELVKKKRSEYENKLTHLYDFRINCVNDKLLIWDRVTISNLLKDYNKTYDLLADDLSKKTMELFLQAAVNGRFDELYENCKITPSYFNSLTETLKVDVFVDCGSFNGVEISDFARKYSEYKKIIAIEPDEQNILLLKENLRRNDIKNVEIVNKGVWSCSTTLRFSSDLGEASFLCDTGGISIPTISVDELLIKETGNVFIKMDIEGSEIDALVGAKDVIKRLHPAMAICVYHREDDLIKIPQLILNYDSDDYYNYYLRFHGNSTSELVLYVIPKDYV